MIIEEKISPWPCRAYYLYSTDTDGVVRFIVTDGEGVEVGYYPYGLGSEADSHWEYWEYKKEDRREMVGLHDILSTEKGREYWDLWHEKGYIWDGTTVPAMTRAERRGY